jgi:hypothetical protein
VPTLKELKPLPYNTDRSRWSKTLKSYKYDLVENALTAITVTPLGNLFVDPANLSLEGLHGKRYRLAATYADGSVDTNAKVPAGITTTSNIGSFPTGASSTFTLSYTEGGVTKGPTPAIEVIPQAEYRQQNSHVWEYPLDTFFGTTGYANALTALHELLTAGQNAVGTRKRAIADLVPGLYVDLPTFTIQGRNHGTQRIMVGGVSSYRNFPDVGDNPLDHVIFTFKYLMRDGDAANDTRMDTQYTTDRGGYHQCNTMKARLDGIWKDAIGAAIGGATRIYPLTRNVDGGSPVSYAFTKREYEIWLPSFYEVFGRKYDLTPKADNPLDWNDAPTGAYTIASADENANTHRHLPIYNKDLSYRNPAGTGYENNPLRKKRTAPDDESITTGGSFTNGGLAEGNVYGYWWLQTSISRQTYPWCFAIVYSGSFGGPNGADTGYSVSPCFAFR